LKVASIVYATDQGLGYLAKSFWDAGILSEVLIVKHQHRPTHQEWFPGQTMVNWSSQMPKQARGLVQRCDALLFFETPFWWDIIPFAREQGKKTFLCPMHECEPKVLPYVPDRYINPSLLDQRCYPDNSVFIPVPVEDLFINQWRQRMRAYTFVHNAGHGGLKGRNGTRELIEAMQYVKADIELVIRSQKPLEGIPNDPRIKVKVGTVPREQLYSEGDVFIFPEKFNGLSLPLQEACASGMLVMATDRFPMNQWLPTEPLIPVKKSVQNEVSGRCRTFLEAVIDPVDIAAKIDEFSTLEIGHWSGKGYDYGQQNSWDVLRPRYLEELSR